jgi:hypothetical protein
MQVFEGFIYHDFLNMYAKWFRFPKQKGILKSKSVKIWKKFSKYPFYGLDDVEYQDFIKELITKLSPRFFPQGRVIHQENDPVLEIQFLLKGSFEVGFSY